MNRKVILSAVALLLFTFIILIPSSAQYRRIQRQRFAGQPTQAQVRQVLQQWPDQALQAAEDTIEKYGLPHEATSSMLIWHNVSPWKRIVAHKDEVPHNFPTEHVDVLEYVVSYQVPPDRFDELAEYNGSVKADRTRGELSVRCQNETMNIATLNFAQDVISQGWTVESARNMASSKLAEVERGVMPYETRRLTFSLMARSGDADRAVRASFNPQR